MPYIKVKFFIAVILILIAGGMALTSLPRVSAQRENPLSADEQKLLEVAANQYDRCRELQRLRHGCGQ